MGPRHIVVPHAEFVLQVATPRAFAIMTETLTITCMRQIFTFSFHINLVFILHAFEFSKFTIFLVQNSTFSQSAYAY